MQHPRDLDIARKFRLTTQLFTRIKAWHASPDL